MSMFSLARDRPTRGRRLAFALLAVPAILAGLLAMHVLNTGEMSSAPEAAAHSPHQSQMVSLASHSIVSESYGDPAGAASVPMSPGDAAPQHDCGGPCTPGHEMLGMMCVLALLVTIILFTRQLGLAHGQYQLLAAPGLTSSLANLAPPRPPSLHALSISRT